MENGSELSTEKENKAGDIAPGKYGDNRAY